MAVTKRVNAGKASTSPDERTVSDVSERAVALGKALRDALAEAGRKVVVDQRLCDGIQDYWDAASMQEGCHWARMPEGWESSVLRWTAIGVPKSVILNAIDTAMRKRGVTGSDKWRYACGVIWRTVDQASQVATGGSPARKCEHCPPCVDPDFSEFDGHCLVYSPAPGDESDVCPRCGSSTCTYFVAHSVVVDDGMQHEWQRNVAAIRHYRECPEVQR